jgi:hypothetical protein
MHARFLPFLLAGLIAACAPDDPPHASLADTAMSAVSTDSAFAAVQERGKGVMGVDQYTSQHVFEDLLDGGRIVLERNDSTDVAAISQIRSHMRDILADFTRGDFSKPFGVHAQQVPGTEVMASRRDSLKYDVFDRPRGAELRIMTSDPVALAAVHEFLAFQRMDHRAAGHDGHDGH